MKHYFVYSLNIFWHLQVFSDSLLYSKPLSEVCQLNIFKEPTVSLIFSTVSLFSISLIPALIISLCRSSLGYFAHGFSRYWVGSLDYWIEIFFFAFLYMRAVIYISLLALKWSWCIIVSNCSWPYGMYPTKLLCPCNSPGKNNGVGCHAPLQGLSPHLLCLWHWQQVTSSIAGNPQSSATSHKFWYTLFCFHTFQLIYRFPLRLSLWPPNHQIVI